VSDDARRRYYGVTEAGRKLVAEEAARLLHLLDYADRAHLIAGG
jgi:DNA-binding MarR family transcriptional regulator